VDRTQFEELRRLPGKVIEVNLAYSRRKKNEPDLVEFEGAKVQNALGWNLLLNGSYDRRTRATIFNFFVEGVGPICRVEVNSTIHGDAGRTHKHELKTERCPRQNLRECVMPRPELEDKTPRQIWDTICRQANIDHTGGFEDPSEGA
jgi:hypothetical protein